MRVFKNYAMKTNSICCFENTQNQVLLQVPGRHHFGSSENLGHRTQDCSLLANNLCKGTETFEEYLYSRNITT